MKLPLVVRAVAVGLLVVGLGAACRPIDEVDFGSFTFSSDACDPIVAVPPAHGYELEGGSVRNGQPQDRGFYSVSLRQEIAYGDLTGDGIDEAAVILDCSTGNRPIPVGRVMAGGGVEPVVLGPVPSPEPPPNGRRVELMELAITDGTIDSTWVVLLDGDAPCCPTGTLTVRLRWNGSELVTTSR